MQTSGKRAATWLLAVLLTLGVFAAEFSMWVQKAVLSRDGYTAITKGLRTNEVVVEALTEKTVRKIANAIDPKSTAGAIAQYESGRLLQTPVRSAYKSRYFEPVWNGANASFYTAAHRALRGRAVKVSIDVSSSLRGIDRALETRNINLLSTPAAKRLARFEVLGNTFLHWRGVLRWIDDYFAVFAISVLAGLLATLFLFKNNRGLPIAQGAVIFGSVGMLLFRYVVPLFFHGRDVALHRELWFAFTMSYVPATVLLMVFFVFGYIGVRRSDLLKVAGE